MQCKFCQCNIHLTCNIPAISDVCLSQKKPFNCGKLYGSFAKGIKVHKELVYDENQI